MDDYLETKKRVWNCSAALIVNFREHKLQSHFEKVTVIVTKRETELRELA